jgi:hypothetical protein
MGSDAKSAGLASGRRDVVCLGAGLARNNGHGRAVYRVSRSIPKRHKK